MKVYILTRQSGSRTTIMGVYKDKKVADRIVLKYIQKGSTDLFSIEESDLY